MKTSNSVLCAVVVFGLGLSAAVSPPQALAAIERLHPASMCAKLAGGANITRGGNGIILNGSPTANLYVTCDLVNEIDLDVAGNHPRITEGAVSTRDRHHLWTYSVRCFSRSAAFRLAMCFIRSSPIARLERPTI